MSIRIVMFTGDNRTTAQTVADTLGIDQVQAGVLPEPKAVTVKQLRAEGRIGTVTHYGHQAVRVSLAIGRVSGSGCRKGLSLPLRRWVMHLVVI